jgi:hypothetical protein
MALADPASESKSREAAFVRFGDVIGLWARTAYPLDEDDAGFVGVCSPHGHVTQNLPDAEGRVRCFVSRQRSSAQRRWCACRLWHSLCKRTSNRTVSSWPTRRSIRWGTTTHSAGCCAPHTNALAAFLSGATQTLTCAPQPHGLGHGRKPRGLCSCCEAVPPPSVGEPQSQLLHYGEPCMLADPRGEVWTQAQSYCTPGAWSAELTRPPARCSAREALHARVALRTGGSGLPISQNALVVIFRQARAHTQPSAASLTARVTGRQ